MPWRRIRRSRASRLHECPSDTPLNDSGDRQSFDDRPSRAAANGTGTRSAAVHGPLIANERRGLDFREQQRPVRSKRRRPPSLPAGCTANVTPLGRVYCPILPTLKSARCRQLRLAVRRQRTAVGATPSRYTPGSGFVFAEHKLPRASRQVSCCRLAGLRDERCVVISVTLRSSRRETLRGP